MLIQTGGIKVLLSWIHSEENEIYFLIFYSIICLRECSTSTCTVMIYFVLYNRVTYHEFITALLWLINEYILFNINFKSLNILIYFQKQSTIIKNKS